MSRNTHQTQLQVPLGIEKALYLAATDERFKSLLLTDRERALQTAQISLIPSERGVLAAIPDAVLESMIATVRPENTRRRRFMKVVAAAAASLAASATIGVAPSCSEPTGIGPDWPDDDDDDDDDDDNDASGDSDSETDGDEE